MKLLLLIIGVTGCAIVNLMMCHNAMLPIGILHDFKVVILTVKKHAFGSLKRILNVHP